MAKENTVQEKNVIQARRRLVVLDFLTQTADGATPPRRDSPSRSRLDIGRQCEGLSRIGGGVSVSVRDGDGKEGRSSRVQGVRSRGTAEYTIIRV